MWGVCHFVIFYKMTVFVANLRFFFPFYLFLYVNLY